ncbi:hypothetical protein F2Q70_00043782 [Brassica cretica]|uniref:Uncharacterized protein n=1 Tax=Brassica cretica TaxID=69181 RepID=A0A8S9KFS2_BRACR|nr:hypothetical protein F2Q70_00043782 [Brassica cretica]
MQARVDGDLISRISTLVAWYDSYDNIMDLRWIVKIPALSDDEEWQLRRPLSPPHLGSATKHQQE